MINVPESVRHGTVKMHIISGSADSKADDDLRPDAAPVNGTIILKPTVSSLKITSATPPTTMLLDTLRCPIIEGVLYPPGTELDETETTLEGVILVSSDQPETQPTSLQWQATFDLSSTTQLSPITFNVPVDGVIDLTTVIPAVPSPGTVNVITTETADRAELAADTATQKATAAESSATTAATSATAAETSATAAATSATAAETSATAAQTAAAALRDTGWRNLSDLLYADVTGSVRIRRVGSTVRAHISVKVAVATGAVSVVDLPAGFRGASWMWLVSLISYDVTGKAVTVVIDDGVKMRIMSSGSQMQPTFLLMGFVEWDTNDPFPTTLPGTPA